MPSPMLAVGTRHYGVLLVGVLATLVSSALPRPFHVVTSIGLSVVLILQIRLLANVGHSRTASWLFRAIGWLTLGGLWLWLLTPAGSLFSEVSLLVMLTLFQLQAYPRLLARLSREKRVTSDVLTGSIAGYLLLGVNAALVIALLESAHPGSFSGFTDAVRQQTGGPDSRSIDEFQFIHLTYFAFVTLSTLGYGDVLPITPLAKLTTILFSVIGPIYLAVLMGMLIGRFIQQDQINP